MLCTFENTPKTNLPIMALVSPISWALPLQEDGCYRGGMVSKLVQIKLKVLEIWEGEGDTEEGEVGKSEDDEREVESTSYKKEEQEVIYIQVNPQKHINIKVNNFNEMSTQDLTTPTSSPLSSIPAHPTISTLLAEEFNHILHLRGGVADSDNDADDEHDDEPDNESDDDFYGKYETNSDNSSGGGHYDASDADSVASERKFMRMEEIYPKKLSSFWH
ncbi:hypothetical protein BDZ45DRAFT_734280 [Acephala macrosclerotiorum]|nr:hypothetical protein BDZ45DRAFT_734280 [Acephala macrosclerotiorum]